MTELTRKVVESIQAALDAGELGSEAAIRAVAEAFAQIEQSLILRAPTRKRRGSPRRRRRYAAPTERLRRPARSNPGGIVRYRSLY
jgi:hypothetical protein